MDIATKAMIATYENCIVVLESDLDKETIKKVLLVRIERLKEEAK